MWAVGFGDGGDRDACLVKVVEKSLFPDLELQRQDPLAIFIVI